MNTNLLGVIFVLVSSNYLRVDFKPVPCEVCPRMHHYQAIEQWHLFDVEAVNAMSGTNVETHVVRNIGNNRSVIITNYIGSPTNYLAPGTKPLMPPVPNVMFESQPRRSNTIIQVPPKP